MNFANYKTGVGTILAASAMLLVAACGQKQEATTSPAAIGEDSQKQPGLSGDFVARFAGNDRQTLTAPAGYFVSARDNYVVLSGHIQNAPSGGRPGIWLRMPEAIERAASGNKIVIKALVRATSPGPVALAYSTADVGNSGWKTLLALPEFAEVSFVYTVPLMKKGGGDFVGILPDPENTGQVLHVAEIAVSVF